MQNTEIELERTYLAKHLPEEIQDVEPEEMVDIYIPSTSEHPQLRLRKRGDRYVITKKKPISDDASEQLEITIPLAEEEYAELSTIPGKRLAKNRYKVLISGGLAEVDVFKEALEGLVLIDFEFASKHQKDSFEAPDCCLADVTQEDFVAGGLLAGKTYEDIADKLEEFGYKKIS